MSSVRSISSWRYLPATIGAWLAVVAGVNTIMVFLALHTFPGEAGGNAFDISNHYDAVLRSAELEARPGWKAVVRAEDGRPVATVVSSTGAPMADVTVAGFAARPVGPEHATPLTFLLAQKSFVADKQLPGVGIWDITITIRKGQHALHLTRRVVVR